MAIGGLAGRVPMAVCALLAAGLVALPSPGAASVVPGAVRVGRLLPGSLPAGARTLGPVPGSTRVGWN